MTRRWMLLAICLLGATGCGEPPAPAPPPPLPVEVEEVLRYGLTARQRWDIYQEAGAIDRASMIAADIAHPNDVEANAAMATELLEEGYRDLQEHFGITRDEFNDIVMEGVREEYPHLFEAEE